MTFDPSTNYLHLPPDLGSRSIPVGPDFWATIDQRKDLDSGRLMMAMDFEGDWPTWEIHPAGDEILVMLSGEMRVCLAMPEGEVWMTLEQGKAVVVPKGIWHTANISSPCRCLFLTPGDGTVNRPR